MNGPGNREEFARAHGFDSYSALVDSAAPLPTDESSNWFVRGGEWFVSVDSRGRCFAWSETLVDLEGNEALSDVCPLEMPQVVPASRGHLEETQESHHWMDLLGGMALELPEHCLH